MNNKSYDFSSTQIEPRSKEITSLILERGATLIAKKDLYGDGLENTPHVTVLYGIHELDPSPVIIDIIETYPKFSITLGDISLFKAETYDIVKIDIECVDLHSLRGAFMNNCYFSITHPEYIPHMTVAFVKPGSCDHLIGNPAFRNIVFTADSVVFSCKDGLNRTISLGLR